MLIFLPLSQYIDFRRAMTTLRFSFFLYAFSILGACTEEQPPRSVNEFIENSILLEATVVRCSHNRSETRYDPECVNAREAVSRMAAREEQAGRAALEEQSARKREALRRTQGAAAEARRRTAEANRRREDAEYLAQFGVLPDESEPSDEVTDLATNAPGARIPEAVEDVVTNRGSSDALATDGGNAPVADTAPPSDLGDVRDELRRRGDESASE
jgi:hypothetical protein